MGDSETEQWGWKDRKEGDRKRSKSSFKKAWRVHAWHENSKLFVSSSLSLICPCSLWHGAGGGRREELTADKNNFGACSSPILPAHGQAAFKFNNRLEEQFCLLTCWAPLKALKKGINKELGTVAESHVCERGLPYSPSLKNMPGHEEDNETDRRPSCQ